MTFFVFSNLTLLKLSCSKNKKILCRKRYPPLLKIKKELGMFLNFNSEKAILICIAFFKVFWKKKLFSPKVF